MRLLLYAKKADLADVIELCHIFLDFWGGADVFAYSIFLNLFYP